MTYPAFDYDVLLTRESSRTSTPRVLEDNLGDGYHVGVVDGLNAVLDEWSAVFVGLDDQLDAVDAFFRGLAGAGVFSWQPPGSVAMRLWRATTWSRDFSARKLTATLKEVPA